MNKAITQGIWTVIGFAPLENALLEEPAFFQQDGISHRLSIYRSSLGERPATFDECRDLECAAVWDPTHIVDRLEDHFAGRENKWVESLRPRLSEHT